MSGRIDEHHTLTCGLDLARRGWGTLDVRIPGVRIPGCRNRGCPDAEAFSPNYGDASKVVRALPYAGPFVYQSKGRLLGRHPTAHFGLISSNPNLLHTGGFLPGAIVRYEKGNLTATCFDSIPCTTTGRVQGGAFEAQVSPKLTLGGGVVRHRRKPWRCLCLPYPWAIPEATKASVHTVELAGSSGGHAGGGLCVPTGSGGAFSPLHERVRSRISGSTLQGYRPRTSSLLGTRRRSTQPREA